MSREHVIGTGLGLLTPALLLLIVSFKIEELRVWLCCFSASLFLIGIALIIYGKKTKRAVSMEFDYEEIDLKTKLEQRFAAGHGFVTLSSSMTDEQILTLIKSACTWSKGQAFQVIPPQAV